MVQVYVHDNDSLSDFRKMHHSGKQVSLEYLKTLGVLYQYCTTIEEVDDIAKKRQYENRDEVTIEPEGFPTQEEYMKKLSIFYTEHLHEDEEIRYTIEGSGYFDVRDPRNEDWIRIFVTPGDLLIVPAGMYHRFSVSEANYIKALRLFKEEPKWEAHNSPEADINPVRKAYLQLIKGE